MIQRSSKAISNKQQITQLHPKVTTWLFCHIQNVARYWSFYIRAASNALSWGNCNNKL